MVAKAEPPPQRPVAPEPTYHAPIRRVAIWGPLLVVLALAAMLVAGIWRHLQQKHAQQEFAQQTSKITVEFVAAQRDSKPHELLLPGNMTAMQETVIYARANGYVGRWLVDIGDHVKEGQLLAVLETPELDQQLATAEDTLKRNQASFELARSTAERWQELLKNKVVSKQENDERQNNLQTATATLAGSKSDLARLQELQAFKNVIAPYAGTITSRRVEVGTLVSAGSGNAGTVLFTLAQTDPLRIFVNVPQSDAPLIHVGLKAQVLVRELATRNFNAPVTRTAGAVDQTSRTLLTQLDIANHDGALLAGMYVQVKFQLQDNSAPILIPSNAFVFRSSGTQVALVNNDHKIHWQDIEVGRDFGTSMEVLKGLNVNDHVVMNPSDDLTENLEVTPKQSPQKEKTGESAKGNG